MKLIILSITPYKEKDAIVFAINENENITFRIRSIFNPKSEFAPLNNPLTVIDAQFVEGNYKYPILKSYSLISSSALLAGDLKYLTTLQFLIEVTLKLVIEEERFMTYSFLLCALEALKNKQDNYSIILIYLGFILKINGYDFSINSCLSCGSKKDIVAFSFSEGGFLCKECIDENTTFDLNKEQMLFIRQILGAQDFISIPNLKENDALAILDKFNEFIIDSFGVKLKSIEFFRK